MNYMKHDSLLKWFNNDKCESKIKYLCILWAKHINMKY